MFFKSVVIFALICNEWILLAHQQAAIPNTPAQPTQPTVPTTPAQPTQPTVPTTPAQPTQPTVPTTPTQPTQPTVPTTPTQTKQPTVPTTPTQTKQPSTLLSTAGYNATDDAKTIHDAPDRNVAFLNILPDRTVEQCQQINVEFMKLNKNVPLVPLCYSPQGIAVDGSPTDLIYALTYGSTRMKTAFLNAFLTQYDKFTSICVIVETFVLSDQNKTGLIEEYNLHYQANLQDTINNYKEGDFRSYLNETINRFRKTDTTVPDDDALVLAGKLLDEQGGWGDNRQILDSLLMEKPISLVFDVIQKYPSINGNVGLLDQINNSDVLNDDLKLGYTSLIYYLQDPNKYMAWRIHDSQVKETGDNEATLILIIVCFTDNGLYALDQEFQKLYNGQTIKGFLLEGDNPSPTRKILAAIAERKVQKVSNIVTLTPPPVPPTQMATP